MKWACTILFLKSYTHPFKAVGVQTTGCPLYSQNCGIAALSHFDGPA